jgi:hypothetical protein
MSVVGSPFTHVGITNIYTFFLDSDNSILYVGSGTNPGKIAAVNVSDPVSGLSVLSYISTSGVVTPRNITKYGNTLFASGYYLSTIDVTSPSSISLLDYEASDGYAKGVTIDGTDAICMGSSNNTFRKFDVTNPSAISTPSYASTSPFYTGYDAKKIADTSYLLCAAYSSSLLFTVDTGDLTTVVSDTGGDPDLLGPWSIFLMSNIALVSSITAGSVATISISDPTDISKIDVLAIPQLNDTRGVYCIEDDEVAFAVGRGTSEGYLVSMQLT